MHLHILGICGTFMAGIAAIAREAGHRVTGSDRAAYPPMSEQLAALGIDIVEGYGPAQLSPAPDLVIVGNVMSRGMPLTEALLDSGIPFMSGPEWLYDAVLRRRHVLAVSGTHGKTTTAAMLAWILADQGLAPGWLVGGIVPDLPASARLGDGEVFVIEADEYDTAFFDKRAKFLHYRPRTLVVNNLEFDHADIYADMDAIRWQFHQLLRALPGSGALITRAGDADIAQLLAMGCWTPVQTFSSAPGAAADWIADAGEPGRLRLTPREGAALEGAWQLAGRHNAENAAAAVLAAGRAGVEPRDALASMAKFRGVRRRMELLGEFDGVRLYDDFAHHPTAIARTIEAARSGQRRVLVVLDPRSNTMKLGVHRDSLPAAVSTADRAWVWGHGELGWDANAVFDGTAGVEVLGDTDAIVAAVTAAAVPGDDVIVMSNGSFDGLHAALRDALAARAV